ncbi:cytochrome c [Glycomyces sp. TRM65418]|uniref:cytochrome bc1 complex diheme cytochrome c subunit n=1 Tax=Glycomyces sp. TRM65418 TaxID=2867006 RepID=UPI001CE6E1B4|nr:c-type cytochrome [Glycomyces sp. TRM65418]MCC3765455.1 cytochrome c [Glycomyces sp. TRM65418]QZD55064.1 cytochrome c [Glycomyces sp. TRM65418]
MAASAKRRRGWRKRLGALARFTGALVIVGGLYSVFSPSLYAQEPDANAIDSEAVKGQELYDTSCISCHGDDGEGIEGRGPSLIGVGSAAVEFQVNTGRMPMAAQGAQAPETYPSFTEEEAEWLGAYIEYLGGGPSMPDDLEALVEHADVGEGGELYRVNCSSCHGYAGGGGALSSGAHAPSLEGVSDEELYQAMLTGPQNMPVFADNELTPEQKADIIAYVQYLVNDDKDPGGVFALGRYGPSTEGLAIFLVGMTALLLTTLWIAGKS